MKDSRQQNDRFVLLALLVQTLMWLGLIFYDYGFDERNLVKNPDVADWCGLVLIFWLIEFPVVAYFMLRKKYLLTEHPFRDGFIRILGWWSICLIISLPIIWAVGKEVWIVGQNRAGSGFLDFNGIEYYYIPAIDCLTPALILVINLITATVKMIYRAKRQGS